MMENSEREAQGEHDENKDAVLEHETENGVKYLDTPIKPDTDDKQYRVIKLPNGIVALLISVPSPSRNTQPVAASEEDEYDDDEAEALELDPRARIEREREDLKANCELCINVGKFNDPPEIPGLSGFVAKMVAKGCVGPQANGLVEFIKTRGGYFQHDVNHESTTFSLDNVPEGCLRRSLCRFVRFFISPLMRRDHMIGVRRSVERQFDRWYGSTTPLFQSVGQPGHPLTRHSLQSLSSLRSITHDQLYEEVVKFQKRHYSAHRMTVTVQARLPLDTLEKYVVQCFFGIPSNNLPSEDFSSFRNSNPFDTLQFRRIYKFTELIDKKKEVFKIVLHWAMPSVLQYYRSKPHEYIQWLLHQKTEGSLYRYLEEKKWCHELWSQIGKDQFHHNSLYSIFSLRLELTKAGNENLKEVLKAVFSYINMIRHEGPQKRIFEEIKKIEAIEFRFALPKEDITPDLTTNMHVYPSAEYITGPRLLFEYDPESILTCLNELMPSKMNIVMYEKIADNDPDDIFEAWFEREGTGHEISKDWIEYFETIESNPNFHLPDENLFICDDFTLVADSDNESLYPIKIQSDNLTEIWYKRDTRSEWKDGKKLISKSYFNCQFVSPHAMESVENIAMVQLFVAVIQSLLKVRVKSAVDVGYKYDITPSHEGIWVETSGFSQKLPLLLDTIIRCIAEAGSLTSEDMFKAEKENQLKLWCETFMDPYWMCHELASSISIIGKSTTVDLHAAILRVKFRQFQDFTRNFVERMYIRCLATGNFEKLDVIRHIQTWTEVFKCQPVLSETLSNLQQAVIPRGIHCCRIKAFDVQNYKSHVTNLYQFENPSLRLAMMIQVFAMIMKRKLWNTIYGMQILRGVDESIYGVVGSTISDVDYSITGLTGDEDTVDLTDNLLERFRKYIYETFRDVANEELIRIKEDLIKAKVEECTVFHGETEVNEYWREITTRKYVFDKEQQMLNFIKELTPDDLRTGMMDLMMAETDSRMRKLSIQVVGYDYSWEDTNEYSLAQRRAEQEASIIHTREHSLQYMGQLPEEQTARASGYFITDVKSWKCSLDVFPQSIWTL